MKYEALSEHWILPNLRDALQFYGDEERRYMNTSVRHLVRIKQYVTLSLKINSLLLFFVNQSWVSL